MLRSLQLFQFLRDRTNRKVLRLLLACFAVAAAGIWSVFTWYIPHWPSPSSPTQASKPSHTDQSSVAAPHTKEFSGTATAGDQGIAISNGGSAPVIVNQAINNVRGASRR